MTILRRIANKVLDVAERNAYAHTSAWVRAMRAEMECIQSDWQALLWALGSMRVLLTQRRRKELPPVDEMFRETNKLLDKFDTAKRIALINIFIGAVQALFPIKHHLDWMWICLGLSSLIYWIQLRRMKFDKIPVVTELQDEQKQYRMVLGFWHQMQTGPWFWARISIVFIGLLIEVVCFGMTEPHSLFNNILLFLLILILLLVVVIFTAGRSQAASTQELIDALDKQQRDEKL